ncbi:MAG: hypothetical protein ABMA14_28940, partial [Hyphomonadaceae bacterium]
MSDSSTPGADWKTFRRNTWKSLRGWLVIVGLQLSGALLLTLAHRQGLLDAEGMIRGSMVLIGLGLAASGNRIPKTTDGVQPHTLPLAVLRQKVLRIVGWMMTLGGLAFVGLSAFAPLQFGLVAAPIVLGVCMAIGLGFVVYW